ncbi:hypothetical protein [Agromyces cerinus]|uniref:Uncharacterized protein n=1 Tax=Agromyces cerinus subsp. cerinus TaxID=232089 RepID=A0A1N6GBH0_9MICO|nr:hypothetical protein [Agromyces cerinus]SIO04873.1 hypothetical protein SAMN05443544_2444 [Agromyces cerinus subsp. cerinus]
MNPAAKHRTGVTFLVGAAAAIVIGALIAGSGFLDRFMFRLPPIPGDERITFGVAVIAALAALIWLLVRLGELGRARSRRRALEASVRGEVSCGIRRRDLVARLGELTAEDAKQIRLAARYSIVADELGVAFWNGGRRPRRAVHFAWREVRGIRSDSIIAGETVLSVLVLRVRRGGVSVELPIVLAAERPGRYALSDAPFFAVVRSWKAKHREALAAEGLELPPLTAPIQIIPQNAALARH